ncbi:hypothetical protein RKE29_00915 [Streptomyces sp. B1866]|uniref:hypothetical protein n=1 Tax=Streptomyces sp. B1866 TaxID=3075431 RepID=UPI00288D8D27|nr:hypothetical protein [Streptomyces sp. B1866]MDT3395224.1 hypothetical protein [Streptomyces sp. B1866]
MPIPVLNSPPPRISLMAAGEIREALAAIEEGKPATAIAALLAIDPVSWQAIEHRLVAIVGSDLRDLLLRAAAGSDQVVLSAVG